MKLVNDTDPILRQPTANFDFDSGIDPEKLSTDMAEVMFQNGGLGLAAPQVGLNYRMFLMGDPESAVACFNPSIVDMSPETTYDVEGCLSFPGLFLKVQRPKEVVTQFTDSNGQTQVMTFTDIMARCFCHELEHLDGVLYTDKVAKLTLQMAQKKQRQLLKKLKRKAKRG